MSGFDLERFRSAALEPRQEVIPVPGLAPWFAEGAAPEWTVRGLTGEELARCNEAGSRNKYLRAAVQALANNAALKGDLIEAVESMLGIGGDVPPDLVKRFDMLTFGSVSPALDRQSVIRLFNLYPVVAYSLTFKIDELTTQGPDLGKLAHSTPAPT